MDKLMLPCNCCGEMPVLFTTFSNKGKFIGYFVACDNFDCMELPESDRFKTKEKAILDWNKKMNKAKNNRG